MKKNGKKLSIIIPLYNASNYVDKLFDYFNKKVIYSFEIIFIDDCSSDDTYEKTNNRIKKCKFEARILKNDVNLGAGETRNKGIDDATGEYITFLDSDDIFTNDFFEVVMPILDQNYEIIVFDAWFTFDEKKNIYYSMFMEDFEQGEVSNRNAMVYINGCTWGKIYKREYIKSNKVYFLSSAINEDIPFTKVAMSYAKKIYYLKSVLYCYYQNENSLMHNKKLLSPQNAQIAFQHIETRTKNRYYDETEAIFLIEYLYSTVLTNSSLLSRTKLKNYIFESEKKYLNCYKNKYASTFPKKYRIILLLIQYKAVTLLKIIGYIKNRR